MRANIPRRHRMHRHGMAMPTRERPSALVALDTRTHASGCPRTPPDSLPWSSSSSLCLAPVVFVVAFLGPPPASSSPPMMLRGLLLLALPLSACSLISPFAKALIARKSPLPSELPLALLHYSASLADPQLTVAVGREALETAFAALLGSDRGVRVLSASFPKALDLSEICAAMPEVTRPSTTTTKKKGKKSGKRAKIQGGARPQKGFGSAAGSASVSESSDAPPPPSPNQPPRSRPGYGQRTCGPSQALQAHLAGSTDGDRASCDAVQVLITEAVSATRIRTATPSTWAKRAVKRGLYTTRRVAAGEVVLSVPESLCFCAPPVPEVRPEEGGGGGGFG